MAAGKAPQPTQQLHSHVNDIIWRAMKRSQIPPVKAPVGLLRQDGRKIPRSSDMQAVMNHYTKFLCHSYSLLHLVMITIGWLWWIFADRTNSIVVAKVTVQHSQLFAATFENQLKCCSSLRVCVCVCENVNVTGSTDCFSIAWCFHIDIRRFVSHWTPLNRIWCGCV